ncbi:MAG: polyphosphate kinase 2 family protein [Actinomycetota bacterium]|nr:polyphosphate kinase 2 family protein [Actinomycetota bacterium]MDH4354262.1 polyphosphate kinase 2 family protein [Actinomycetota bacterium]MDH5278006.1 polyphosphate kinase 2 family protein [Actinomycetota bacterium]
MDDGQVLDALRVQPGQRFRLSDRETDWLPPQLRDLDKGELRERARELLDASRSSLSDAQERLYADDRHSLLLVFQAMDAAGKDGTIKHVMSGVNPAGTQVTSFKAPSAEELDHDFLWRVARALPERGRVGIFNRSHYEEVLVVRVHPEYLDGQRLPSDTRGEELWRQRYESINGFERHLARNGTVIVKFFLNVSKREQRQRFLDRLDDADKTWKFNSGDVAERGHWDEYMTAYEDALSATSTEWAPWYVIPADRKPVMRALVANVVARTVDGMDLRFPEVPDEERAALAQARARLAAEG